MTVMGTAVTASVEETGDSLVVIYAVRIVLMTWAVTSVTSQDMRKIERRSSGKGSCSSYIAVLIYGRAGRD